MIFFIELVKALIFLTFPVFLYLFFQTITYKQDLTLFLKISLFSSAFLFVVFVNNIYLSLLINVPLLISYLKRYNGTSLLIVLLAALYFYMQFDVSLLLILIEYFLLFIFLTFSNFKIKVFTILNSYFYSFIIFYYRKEVFLSNATLIIIFMIIISYILCICIKTMISSINNKYSALEDSYRNYLLNFIHEVKNPIAVCKGYLEIINKKNENKNEYEKIIDKEINESLMIMEDYLMLGRFKVNLEYMDINLLLEDVFNMFSILIKEDNINIHFEYNEDEVIILGDYTKLKQVFVNIIKNSIEAKKEDIPLDINISLKVNKNDVVINIEDNGIGIEALEKIGNKFYTTKSMGNGLGVNFSKTIILLHNGEIKYNSRTNKGTKVTITMPLNEV